MRVATVEINCRPERREPPDELLRLAASAGCLFALDTDAHAPEQLHWLTSGYARAARFGLGPERLVTTRPCDQLLARTAAACGRSRDRAAEKVDHRPLDLLADAGPARPSPGARARRAGAMMASLGAAAPRGGRHSSLCGLHRGQPSLG
ncbi:hypothetical protein ACIRYZ_45995 [Kitasatospora sp. NPDC101155]|uniref:hypothetical protein n=1 Tax=Kitasatospora sp. NPDC101155 TaxID=3364097 RepID=UPI0038161CD6